MGLQSNWINNLSAVVTLRLHAQPVLLLLSHPVKHRVWSTEEERRLNFIEKSKYSESVKKEMNVEILYLIALRDGQYPHIEIKYSSVHCPPSSLLRPVLTM